MLNRKVVAMPILIFIFGNAGQAVALSTSIEINNNTSSNEPLVSSSYSGSLIPALPNPLPAYSSSLHVSTTPGTLADGGVFNYLSCRFNWSVLKIGSIYQFSISATPASDCSADVLAQDPFTGEYSVQFDINN